MFCSFLGSAGSDEAPPKPSRYPGQEVIGSNAAPQVSTYIVAQNPEVLVQLLRETERRGINPSVYTTPANAFNTLTVDFDADDTNTKEQATKSLPRPLKFSPKEKTLKDQCIGGHSSKSLSCADFTKAQTSKEFTLVKRINSTNSILTPYNSEVLEASSGSKVESSLPPNHDEVCFVAKIQVFRLEC